MESLWCSIERVRGKILSLDQIEGLRFGERGKLSINFKRTKGQKKRTSLCLGQCSPDIEVGYCSVNVPYKVPSGLCRIFSQPLEKVTVSLAQQQGSCPFPFLLCRYKIDLLQRNSLWGTQSFGKSKNQQSVQVI